MTLWEQCKCGKWVKGVDMDMVCPLNDDSLDLCKECAKKYIEADNDG